MVAIDLSQSATPALAPTVFLPSRRDDQPAQEVVVAAKV